MVTYQDGLENLVVPGRIKGMKARLRQRLKYLDSMRASWKDNVSPTQLIRASKDKSVLSSTNAFHSQPCTGYQCVTRSLPCHATQAARGYYDPRRDCALIICSSQPFAA